MHMRNNEYPYETSPGEWTAPALPGSFSTHEVKRFAQLADRIYEGSHEIISALRRR